MGTQVHCKNYLPGYYSMRDLNEDCNSSSWPLFYGDKTLTSAQYYNGYIPRIIADAYPGYDKDQLKQKMLEHEAIFKNQVYELHRLYRIQRDMMEEIRRKELNKRQMSMEPSSSSSLLGSQMPSEDAGKWHVSRFPLTNSGYPRPSVSGAEIVNSPLSCTKGNTLPSGRVNGCMPKDCDVLEARPSKVRKKLFDLQLPADEYIDTEDGKQLHDSKIIEVSSSLPNGNHKKALESHDKYFLNGGVAEKIDCQRNASASDSCTRSTIRLADLNEPVQLEDVAVPSSVEFLGNSANHLESRGLNLSARPNSGFPGLQKEITNNAHSGNQNGTMTSVGCKSTERDWLSGVHESGEGCYPIAIQRKNNLISLPPGFQQDKLPISSQPAQVRINNTHQPPGILPTDYEREEMWKERTTRGLENHDRVHNNSNYNHLESVISQIPSPYSFVNSSGFTSSWSHSALSWGNPTSSFTQKLNSFPPYPSLQACSIFSKSSKSSAQSHGGLGDKWHNNECSRLNPGIGSDVPAINGFYHGSSSGSKEVLARYPSVSISHLNCSGSDNTASMRYLNRGPGELSNSCMKPAKHMDLNVVQLKCSSNEDVVVIDEKSKPEDYLAPLPWLRDKPSCKNETSSVRTDSNSESFSFFQASPNKLFREGEPLKDLNETLTQKEMTTSSGGCEVGVKKDIGETRGIKKILGVPIFDKPSNLKNESSSPPSTSVTLPRSLLGEKVETEVKNRLIDINLACDEQIASEDLAVEKVTEAKVAHIRNYIDLNSCVTEDEEISVPSVTSNSASVKIAVEIDLEAPVLEIEDDVLSGKEDKQHEASLQPPEPEVEETNAEVVRIAAEAIVSLSSSGHLLHMEENTCQPSEDPLAECLLWFADAVSSCADKHEGHVGKEIRGNNSLGIGNYSSDEMDEFELMTLQLQETKEEDYMPKPFVPEVQKLEESGPNSVPNRSRKGQGRRGRQRRDFQRDILPGLASLSRHEVTEDLQTFGGLMRATGHPWSSGLTRRNGTRNGGGRGRRRAVVVDTVSTVVATATCTPLMQQLNNIETGLEDRSLTGWGKTTRRPRRQRCPAGNTPPAALT